MTEDELQAFYKKYNLIEKISAYSYNLYKNKVQIGMINKRLGINHVDGSLYRYYGVTLYRSRWIENTFYDYDECCIEFEYHTLKFYKKEFERMKMNDIKDDF